MEFELTSISLILFLATGVNIVVAVIAWQKRDGPVGLFFTLGVTSLAFWTLASALDYAAVPVSLKVMFARFQYIGYNSALAFFVMMTIVFTGKVHWLKFRRVVAFIWFLPLTSILLAWTNDWHGWLWSGFTPSQYGNNVLIYHHGPAFAWTAVAGYLAILFIFANLWFAIRNGTTLQKRQSRWLLFALLIPIFGNILYLLNIEGVQGIDWTSVLFTMTGIIMLVTIYRSGFLGLVPIARREVFEQMDDSFLVFDRHRRLIDFNRAAETHFGVDSGALGQDARQVLARWSQALQLLESPSSLRMAFNDGLGLGEEQVFDAQAVAIRDTSGKNSGALLIFRDITEQYIAEQALRQAEAQIMLQQRELAMNEERQRMARDLHDSVSQSIHSVVLFSETLAATLEKQDYSRALQIMKRLEESARQSHKETRLLLYELQAEGPGRHVNLVQDLQERLDRVERHSGLQAEIIQQGSLDNCPQEWHENLFWIAVEALNNALKHARARKIKVLIRSSTHLFEMEVRDDGIGFDPAKSRRGGLGLENMQARAALLGGQLSVESQPGSGVTVRFKKEIRME